MKQIDKTKLNDQQKAAKIFNMEHKKYFTEN